MNLIKKMLAAQAAVLALWAVSAQAATNDEIAERIKPVGEVCVQGEECKGVGAVAVAAGGGAKSPDDVINAHCGACHSAGVLGAPKIGDTAEWKKFCAETYTCVARKYTPTEAQAYVKAFYANTQNYLKSMKK